MGKTKLINKVLERFYKEKSYRTVYISLWEADTIHFSELNKFWHWLCANVSSQLKLPVKLDDWDNLTKTFGAKISCTTYFEQFLLSQLSHPLVLCIDNLDVLFLYDHICQDFLAMLRSWNDKASRNYLWQKLRLVISYATDINIKMNHNQSLFNLGAAMELSEFTPEQVQEFAQLHQLDWNNFQVGELINMVGGHPDLISLTIHHLKTCNHMTLEQILTKAPTENSIYYAPHLKEYLLIFKQHRDLVKVFKNIINGEDLGKEETLVIHQLRNMGLVKYQDSKIVVSCELYRLYFQNCLGDV